MRTSDGCWLQLGLQLTNGRQLILPGSLLPIDASAGWAAETLVAVRFEELVLVKREGTFRSFWTEGGEDAQAERLLMAGVGGIYSGRLSSQPRQFLPAADCHSGPLPADVFEQTQLVHEWAPQWGVWVEVESGGEMFLDGMTGLPVRVQRVPRVTNLVWPPRWLVGESPECQRRLASESATAMRAEANELAPGRLFVGSTQPPEVARDNPLHGSAPCFTGQVPYDEGLQASILDAMDLSERYTTRMAAWC